MDNENTIQILKGADRVRRRPAVIFGSDGVDGCAVAFREFFNNSLAEAKCGFADRISVTVSDDGTVEIRDNGRGVPMGWNEELGGWNWHLIFSDIYVRPLGFPDTHGGIEYGLGAAAAQYASRFTEVYSYDGKNESYMHFTKGDADGELRVTPLAESCTGTLIRWCPDDCVFTSTRIPKDFFVKTMTEASEDCHGTRFVLSYLGESEEFFVLADVE